MFKKALFITTLSLMTLFQGCSDSSDANKVVASETYNLTDTANRPFTVTKEGNNFTVAGHDGKVVIFDIFATWCPPCRAEAPHLANLQKKFPDALTILGVTIETDKSNADLEAFKNEYGADYTLINSKDNEKLSRAIASAIHVGQRFPIPLMVMYKDGKYVTHYVGAIPEEMIESDIKKALGR
jgi:thiol-disulfide isomerase/thioredoxin